MDTYAPRTIEEVQAIRAKQRANAARIKSAAASSSSAATSTAATPSAVSSSSSSASSIKKVNNAGTAKDVSATREDGRTASQMRPTFLQVGLITAASGSAYVERQGTKIICGIYGPRASKKYSTQFSSERGQFLVEMKFAPFAQRNRRASKRAMSGTSQAAIYEQEEREYAAQLQEAVSVSIHLESFPKAVLEAYVLVLQDEGGVLSSATTCISLALADAGIMLYDMVTACEVVEVGGMMMLDPSAQEAMDCLDAQSEVPTQQQQAIDSPSSSSTAQSSSASSSAASLLLAYMPSLKQITAITQTGVTDTQRVKELTHLCIAGCEQLNGLMRECLVDAAKKKMQLQTTIQ